jgi:hypothetical protein
LVDSALEVGEVYDAKILPMSLLIDRQGEVRSLRLKPFEPGQLEAGIETLLSEGP